MTSSLSNSMNSFLLSLRQSGLIEPAQLDTILVDIAGSIGQLFGNSLTSLITLLIERRYLTEWQAGKLRHDKYKGFVQGDFVLLDELETDSAQAFQRYLARDKRRNALVTLKVFPPGNRRSANSPCELEGDFA